MDLGRFRAITLFLAVVITTPVLAENSVHITYSEPLRPLASDTARPVDAGKPTSGTRLRFEAFGREFDLRLQTHHALLGSEPLRSVNAGIDIYRGEVAGIDGSWVRLVVADGKPRGMLYDGTDIYAVEAVPGQTHSIIYRLDDLLIEPGMLSCSHSYTGKSATAMLESLASDLSVDAARAPGATLQMDMAIIGDFEFTAAKGASAEADLIARMNNVDGIFSAQLGVQLNINRIDTYTDDNDPFSDSLSSGTLLGELSAYRESTPEQYANGLTHLFTGRNFDGSTVGRAYRPGACSRRFGAGVTQGTFNLTTDSLIAAHEIGHNFGAQHDGEAGSACEAEPRTFLMSPSVNGSDQFSACTLSQMQSLVSGASCFSPVATTDAAVIPGTTPSSELLGNSATVSFIVNSTGSESIDDVNLAITVPGLVNVDSAFSSQGNCSSGAGSANCSVGTLATGAAATITLDVTAVATGSASFTASLSANNDENSSNNESSVQFTIEPAIDLIATAAPAAQVFLAQSADISLSVQNVATLQATDAVLTVTPSAGLPIASAVWSAGTCSVSNGTLTCTGAALAAQSTNTVVMRVDGATDGDFTYEMTVSANETDRDTTNNSASGDVTVAANAPPTLSITAPGSGASFATGSRITFSASAADTEDGDISDDVAWSSDRDGALGNGASLNITSLSVGNHVISASVSDSGTANATTTVSVTITEAPTSSGGGNSDSGGGGVGVLFLLMIAIASRLRRIRRCGSRVGATSHMQLADRRRRTG